ncbi:MAG: sigma-70 family RNA polymerase sigma factor [Oscillospiraceae bacterium]|nr:sigma-70 family RNA polymerase sigma factor [Oscillospiraceae bacterium]
MNELFRRAKGGDKNAAEQILTENTGLVWSVVRRFLGRGTDADDLYQLGCIGFLKAVEGYDEAFGTQFSTYAVPKIAGEIRRFLRDDGAIKVSRTLKERAALICAVRQRLQGTLGREPTLSELSAETSLTAEEIAGAETAVSAAQSLQESSESGFSPEQSLSSGNGEDDLLDKLLLREALDRLPERERMIICLRFLHGLTQDKTAQIVKVSQVQVSRLERKALQIMRTYIVDKSEKIV